MYRKIFLVATLLFLLPALIFATEGKLRGVVTDEETGEPLPGANVILEETVLGASTDLEGVYVVLAVSPGRYTVRVSYIGYQTLAVSNIRVSANLTTTKDFQLTPTTIDLGAIEVVAERPLIQRNTTNTIRMTTQEDIQNMPIRGLDNILALEAGTVLQDGILHIRGGREREVAYFIDNATATVPYVEIGLGGRGMQSQNPGLGEDPNYSVIQESIEEIQMQAGGYTAEFGGGNSAIVRTTMRSGGPRLRATVDYRTDAFAKEGEQFLGTSSYGYQNAVLTLSGPMPLIPKLRFFAAGQYNYMDNRTPSFIEPFKFEGLTEDGYAGRSAYTDSLLPENGTVEFKRNHLPDNWRKDGSIQGTLLYPLTDAFKLRFTGSYRGLSQLTEGHLFGGTQASNSPSSLYNYFNMDRRPERRERWGLTSLRATHILNPKTFYEVTLSYSNRSYKRFDPEFEDDWRSYPDSIANYEKGYGVDSTNQWLSRYRPPIEYSTINNFEFQPPGFPTNQYEKNSQSDIGAALDFTTQMTKTWELKAGGRFDQWTMRRFNIRDISDLMEVEYGPDGSLDPDRFASDYERWVKLARSGDRLRPIIYGYDIDGEEYDEFPNGPRKPLFASFYLQNKFEHRDMILNLGLRFERIDINAPMPKNLEEPAFDEDLDWIIEDEMEESDPYDYWLPRVTFSFPVTDKTVFYTLYGKYVQMPNLSSIYHGVPKISMTVSEVTRRPYGYFGDWVGFSAKPEHTTQYEMGIRQSITDNFALTATGFYKDLRDQLRWDVVRAVGEEYDTEGEIQYAGRLNNDFGTVKGVELTLELRRTKRLTSRANYTWSDTRGTGSDSRQSRVCVSDEVIAEYPTLIFPLDHHQPHRGSVMLDYRFGKGDGGKLRQGMGMNLLLTFNSGHAYTKIVEPQNLGQANAWNVGVRALGDSRFRNPEEPLNSSLTPWNFNVDLNLNKLFYLGGINVDVYVNVLNLFDTKHVINVYPMTGTAEDDGWLRAPLAAPFNAIPNYTDFYRAINSDNRWAFQGVWGQDLYGTPRQIRFGVRLEL
ncbi:TonB-dependent receptor [candidate division KSB1 bacterium]|nr:TonB-dependent receptor [candidate division KSB1 bacterium]